MGKSKKTIAMVTGATSGIGLATAHRLAEEGYALILVGRRAVTLKKVVADIEEKFSSSCLGVVLDVRNRQAVRKALFDLPEEWMEIDVLVNNAGLAAGLDPVHEADCNDWEQMIDTNVKGILYLTRLITPGMVDRKRGHIVNISSIAGKEVYPNASVYCASKHAVEALTKGMRIDLLPHGIKVSSVAPGAAETEFSLVRFKGDEKKSKAVYKGFDPLLGEDVADAIHYILTRPAHVNIQDVLIMPAAQGSATQIHRKQ